jgi:CheY-like chemotaxis protein
VPPGERKTIFEEFQRGRAIDRPASGGFGLGLSIVQRMAEALGHPFDMCSRIGHGTRFSISAPFAGMAQARAAQNTVAPAAHSYGLGGVKVAVLDNDTYVLEAMQSLLESWGCEVRLLQSVSDLAGLIESGFRPAILLVDYHLDDGTCGLTAVARLRLAMGEESVAGIVITADHSPSVSDASRFAGCELLLKPVKPAELRALMRHLAPRAIEAKH